MNTLAIAPNAHILQRKAHLVFGLVVVEAEARALGNIVKGAHSVVNGLHDAAVHFGAGA